MNKNRDNTLCEYSDEESAFVKGALSSNGDTEGVKTLRMKQTAVEYTLCDFSMFKEMSEDMDPTDLYLQEGATVDSTNEELMAMAFAKAAKNPSSEEYNITADAYIIREDDGRMIVCYMESIDGENEQLTEIHFDLHNPNLVTICKTGMVSTVMTIEQDHRHSCVYRTPFMDFEMRVHALRVDNKITENGGTLYLDYALEIRGAEAHRTVMDITITE